MANSGRGRGPAKRAAKTAARGKQAKAAGQQRTHTITHPEQGERQVTQQEWREQGAALREEGWQRPASLRADVNSWPEDEQDPAEAPAE